MEQGQKATGIRGSLPGILGSVTKPAMQKSTHVCSSILAVDYGRARLGLAIADADSKMPQPLGALERVNRNEDMRQLRELAREHGVKQIVVGLPLRLDGTRGEMAEEAERFARRVHKQLGLPVQMIDERLTSWEAERLLEETQGRFLHGEKGGVRKKKNAPAKTAVDAIAAAVILKEFLERQGQPAERGQDSNPAEARG